MRIDYPENYMELKQGRPYIIKGGKDSVWFIYNGNHLLVITGPDCGQIIAGRAVDVHRKHALDGKVIYAAYMEIN